MKSKNQKSLNEEIEISDGIDATLEKNEIIMKKNGKEVRRKLSPLIDGKIEGNKVILSTKKSTKMERKNFGSAKAHVKNMIEGLNKGFKYKLQIASVHFPITTEVNKTNNEFIVKNFLGEKKGRIIRIIPGVEVKVDKNIIEVESEDIEKAGQVAANIEKGTKIRFRDRRVFQDGIFIISKPRKEFL